MSCNAAGNDTKQLLTKNKIKYYNCVISPDGSKMIYYAVENEEDDFWIHCADLDGSNDKMIYAASGLYGYGGEPMAAFSGDSKRIGIAGKQYNYIWLFTSNSDGTDFRMQNALHGFGFMEGSLSPDGSRFAYSCLDGFDYDIEFDSSNIAVYNINTKENKILTSDDINSFMLVWSPDGSQLAFFRHPGKLCLINSDGTNLRQTNCNGIIFSLYDWWFDLKIKWSPDGSQVMYVVTNAEDYNTADIYILDVSTMKISEEISKKSIGNAFWY